MIRWPSEYIRAGSSVRPATTAKIGTSIPPMPIERMNGTFKATSTARPIATVVPEKMIV